MATGFILNPVVEERIFASFLLPLTLSHFYLSLSSLFHISHQEEYFQAGFYLSSRPAILHHRRAFFFFRSGRFGIGWGPPGGGGGSRQPPSKFAFLLDSRLSRVPLLPSKIHDPHIPGLVPLVAAGGLNAATSRQLRLVNVHVQMRVQVELLHAEEPNFAASASIVRWLLISAGNGNQTRHTAAAFDRKTREAAGSLYGRTARMPQGHPGLRRTRSLTSIDS